MAKTPRGMRNNNPGNIEFKKGTKWLGQTGVEPEGRFATFENPQYGIRAIAVTLRTYREKHKLRTVRQFISRWAPESENNVDAYVKASGFAPGYVIDIDSDEEMTKLVAAIIKHENGMQPYSLEVVRTGVEMSRRKIEKPKPLADSKTMKGAQVTMVGATGSAATTAIVDAVNGASQTLQPMVEFSEIIRYAFLALVFVGIGITVYARIKQHNAQDVK